MFTPCSHIGLLHPCHTSQNLKIPLPYLCLYQRAGDFSFWFETIIGHVNHVYKHLITWYLYIPLISSYKLQRFRETSLAFRGNEPSIIFDPPSQSQEGRRNQAATLPAVVDKCSAARSGAKHWGWGCWGKCTMIYIYIYGTPPHDLHFKQM